MSRFIFKFVLFSSLISTTLFSAIWLIPPDSKIYIAAINDKHEILASTESPKIVFVGGSNIAFGLDSQLIENKLGINVVNMGLHEGIGLRYMLEHIKPFIHPSDIVVIIPEYSHFYHCLNGNRALVEMLVEFPKGIRYISSIEQIFILIKYLPVFLKSIHLRINKCLERLVQSSIDEEIEIYDRRGFNNKGDLISYLKEKPDLERARKELLFEQNVKHTINTKTILSLNNFYSFACEHGVKVYFIFPGIQDIKYKKNEKYILTLYNKLKNDLFIPLLSSPKDYSFPIEYFFDTNYHLNAKGRRIRTEKVIADLKSVLSILNEITLHG